MDTDARDAVFAAMLAERPDAFVSAVTIQGLLAPAHRRGLADEVRPGHHAQDVRRGGACGGQAPPSAPPGTISGH